MVHGEEAGGVVGPLDAGKPVVIVAPEGLLPARLEEIALGEITSCCLDARRVSAAMGALKAGVLLCLRPVRLMPG